MRILQLYRGSAKSRLPPGWSSSSDKCCPNITRRGAEPSDCSQSVLAMHDCTGLTRLQQAGTGDSETAGCPQAKRCPQPGISVKDHGTRSSCHVNNPTSTPLLPGIAEKDRRFCIRNETQELTSLTVCWRFEVNKTFVRARFLGCS